MTFKQINVNQGYPVLEKLATLQFKPLTAFKIFKLKNALNEYYMFAREEQTKIFEKYGIKQSGDGAFHMENPDPENIEKFNKDMSELLSIEYTLEDGLRPEIELSSMDNLNITPNELEYVSLFVSFIES